MLSDVAISVNNVSKTFFVYENAIDRLKQPLINRLRRISGAMPISLHKEFHAVKNVSFNVKKGETIGIVGKNGSGKSTILQIITGILTPSHGNVNVHGRIAALLELGSGFNFEFTGRENVYLNASIMGLSRKETDEKYDDIVAFADIGSFIDEPVKSYSSGMMVRLAFAVAINIEPEILIIDEALAVGDELFQRKCFSKIEEIKNKGATIIFVSHSGPAVVELCDRAVLMDSGECIAIGKAKHIVNAYQKLIYAPHQLQEKIRDEIRNDDLNIKSNDVVQTESKDESASSINYILDVKEFYDPNLISQNITKHVSHGAHISNPSIETLDGQQVNHLVRGRKYKYKYDVLFDKDIDSVRFGMLIKTVKGIELGGGISAPKNSAIKQVTCGTKLTVEFLFDCNLNPDTYFLNSGVLGIVNDYETYIDRSIDVAIFKVQPEEELTSTCIVDFNCFAKIKGIN
ncbi:ABC transporter ATP-binding protein [Moritella sp. 28]|uniref:ABC transporter ATP-binding protein n=1 Tax=Moritella sp. 28 TaxID=2746232 RepID=UPI001BACE6FF|nr:ABC transporter ATP-binding protein [Moritella sp. 28]QUM83556.1 ABC transporter ATP-binding protein [Moritella sp. 28]